MATEQEKMSRNKLLKLVEENPDLPVIPIVDGEIPGDDCGYWLGAWGNSRIDEYLLVSNRDLVVFKSDDDVFDVLERCLSDENASRYTMRSRGLKQSLFILIGRSER